MNDDTQLIDETLAGQSAAFGQLVTKYQDGYTTRWLMLQVHWKKPRTWFRTRSSKRFSNCARFRNNRRSTPGSTASPLTWPLAASGGVGPRCRWMVSTNRRVGNQWLSRNRRRTHWNQPNESTSSRGARHFVRRVSDGRRAPRDRWLLLRDDFRDAGFADRHSAQPFASSRLELREHLRIRLKEEHLE